MDVDVDCPHWQREWKIQRDSDSNAAAATEATREPSSLRTGSTQVCAEVRIVDAGLEYAAAFVVRLFKH